MKKKDNSVYATFSLNKIDSPKGKDKNSPKATHIKPAGSGDLRNGGRK